MRKPAGVVQETQLLKTRDGTGRDGSSARTRACPGEHRPQIQTRQGSTPPPAQMHPGEHHPRPSWEHFCAGGLGRLSEASSGAEVPLPRVVGGGTPWVELAAPSPGPPRSGPWRPSGLGAHRLGPSAPLRGHLCPWVCRSSAGVTLPAQAAVCPRSGGVPGPPAFNRPQRLGSPVPLPGQPDWSLPRHRHPWGPHLIGPGDQTPEHSAHSASLASRFLHVPNHEPVLPRNVQLQVDEGAGGGSSPAGPLPAV